MYRVVLADDHSIFREGLQTLLQKQEGYEVVGAVNDGNAAVELCRELQPDLVIMDLSMQGLDGFDATKLIRKECRKTRVLILSMHSHRALVDRAYKHGASAFLVKEDAFNELSRAMEMTLKGETYMSSSLLEQSDPNVSSSKEGARKLADLTEREIEVLKYLSEGWPNKAIAAHMDLSIKTVEAHRSKLMRKLKLYSAAELTKFAIREGLVSL